MSVHGRLSSWFGGSNAGPKIQLTLLATNQFAFKAIELGVGKSTNLFMVATVEADEEPRYGCQLYWEKVSQRSQTKPAQWLNNWLNKLPWVNPLQNAPMDPW